MPMESSHRSLVTVGAILVLLTGLVVITGWYTGYTAIAQIVPGMAAMQFNTALCFVAAGSGLLALLYESPAGLRISLVVLFPFSLLTLAEYVLRINIGIVQLFFTPPVSIPNPFPGRMGVNTASCFTLIALALLLSSGLARLRRALFGAFIATCATLVLSGGALLGYVATLLPGGDWGPFTQMALHTSIGFILLAGTTLLVVKSRIRARYSDMYLGSPLPWMVFVAALMLTVLAWYMARNYPGVPEYISAVTLAVGTGASVVLLAIIWGLANNHIYAMAMAREKTLMLDVNQQRLARLVDEIQDYAIFFLDNNGIVQSWNRGAERIKGYTEREIVGQSFAIFYSQQDRQNNLPQHLLDTARENGRVQHEGWRLKKDGTRFWADIVITAQPDASGSVYGYAKITRDLSEQRRTLERLRSSYARFQKLLESAPDAMIIVDGNGIIQLVNTQSERLFGYPKHELLQQPVEILVPQAHRRQHALQRSHYSVAPGMRMMGEGQRLSGRRKNGDEFAVEVALSPIETEEELLVCAAVRDITERLQAEQQIHDLNRDLERRVMQLQAVNQELESFSYSVSHDLRAPLRAIAGYGNVLLEDHCDSLNDDGREAVQIMIRNATRMGQLIDDVLAFARLGRQDIKRERIDMQALFAEAYRELMQSEAQRDMDFKLGDLRPALGDREMLRLVVDNLLSNAIKYTRTRDKAVVDVSGLFLNGVYVYRVSDNGVGFNSDYNDKLFGVFQRLHKRSEFEGTGVGLAIVQRVVQRHGGTVSGEGVLDKGAAFSFTLPLAED